MVLLAEITCLDANITELSPPNESPRHKTPNLGWPSSFDQQVREYSKCRKIMDD